jgi:hypothetical protein
LTARPNLSGYHLRAARVAALAGCGKAEASAPLDEANRAGWRKQALDWLRAELDRLRQLTQMNSAKSRQTVQDQLHRWKDSPDLAALRNLAALVRLPEAEWPAWQKLWADCESLLQQVRRDRP